MSSHNINLLILIFSLLPMHLHAAAFQLHEYAASGAGRAFAGEGAIADNAAVGSRNPAAMTRFQRPTGSVGASFIHPNVSIQGTSHSGADLGAKNIAPNAWIPNLHFIYPIDPQWAIGFSTTSNFGLATKYDPLYPAGAAAGKTDLMTANINASAAYRLNQHISLGFGLNAVYSHAEIIRYAGEFGPAGVLIPGKSIPADTQLSYLKGHQWSPAWNIGILYEIDTDSRLALTYRSKIDVKFKDNYHGLNTQQKNVPARLTLNLPEIWEFSAYQRVATQWALHYGLLYTTWNRFQELAGVDKAGNTLFQKHEGYRNAYRIALGTTYYHNPFWTFRAGIAFDDSPVPATNNSFSIPDQDRAWISTGATYAFNEHFSIDMGIAYMKGKNTQIKEVIHPKAPPYTVNASGTVWLYSVNVNYAF